MPMRAKEVNVFRKFFRTIAEYWNEKIKHCRRAGNGANVVRTRITIIAEIKSVVFDVIHLGFINNNRFVHAGVGSQRRQWRAK